jgi:beta-glucosidase/6-phospho-beta-glucosidase/beta-galactosidase
VSLRGKDGPYAPAFGLRPSAGKAGFLPLPLAALLCAGCGLFGSSSAPTDGGPPAPSYRIDAGFLFGTATSAYQVEGGGGSDAGSNDNADWYQWERVSSVTFNDGCTILNCDRAEDGPDDYDLFAADLAQAKAMGTNAYRFSIEWSRVQPTEGGPYDPAAIAHYHAVLAACQANGLTPMVTLSHVTLPQWLHGIDGGTNGTTDTDWVGGWRGLPGETPGPTSHIVQAFGQFAGDMAQEYGSEVDLWITLEDPLLLVYEAYVVGYWPPGAILHLTDARNAIVNMAYANGAAYDAIHLNDTHAQVGVATEFRVFQLAPGANPDGGALITEQYDYIYNWLYLNAIVNGDLDTHFDGSFNHPGDPEGEGQGIAALAGRADFLGMNYYSVYLVTPTQYSLLDAQGSSLFLPGTIGENADPTVSHGDAPVSEEIYPQGLQDELVSVANNFPLLPIYVTENGVADSAGNLRPSFLVDHIQQMQQAMADGVDVLGYFHWSLLDNFDWQYGFGPRYGLLSVDYQSDAGLPRTVTTGAQVYQQIIEAGGVTPALVAQWPAPDAG